MLAQQPDGQLEKPSNLLTPYVTLTEGTLKA